jgi:hypothetical protein
VIAVIVIAVAAALAWPGLASAAPAPIRIGPEGEALAYFRCATEGERCLYSGDKYVAFGANGQFVFRRMVGSFACTRETFGDPIEGVVKACYFANYARRGTEGTASHVSEPTEIAYGANGEFHFRTINGQFLCNNDTFGDPIHGVIKACYVALEGYRFGAFEGGTLTDLNHTPVAYGANGNFIYRVVTGSISCSFAGFGDDPAVGTPKLCYRFGSEHVAPEGADYSVPASGAVVSYGSGENGAYLTRTATTGSCTNGFFAGDPDVNVVKACYWREFTID